MRAVIGNNLLLKLKPKDKQYDVRDTKLSGFLIRVNPSGKMLYVCQYKRGRRINIGQVGIITPVQARDRAKKILADVVQGNNPESNRNKGYTLKDFIEKDFGDETLADISPLLVDRWRSKRIAQGIKPITVNRDIAILKALLSKAKEWNLIAENPLLGFKSFKVDSIAKVRYLSKDEEKHLKETLQLRDKELKQARIRANQWRVERGYDVYPDISKFSFADYMTPMILLSLNTGLRRGELFGLQWKNINFELAVLTVSGDTAKSGKTRHVPLNTIALNVLKKWHEQNYTDGFVFTNYKTGLPFDNVKKAWVSILIAVVKLQKSRCFCRCKCSSCVYSL